jgi:SAM-dependent methyltransferase
MSTFRVASFREREPEVMDDPALDAERHRGALRGLARINRLSASSEILWRPIRRLARESPGKTLRVLDVATGSGDIPLGLWKKARRAGIELELAGIDISPIALEFARERAARVGAQIDFRELDALAGNLPADFDVICTSLFLHHLDDAAAIALLRKMASAARRMVLVNDLVRETRGLLLAHLASHLFTSSDVVRTDAPLSVRAAFTLDEMRALANEAGLFGAGITRRWPCRFLLAWTKP